jgi:hypothetical protein
MADDENSDLRAFWGKVWAALCRLIALGIFLTVHFILNRAFAFVIPPNLISSLVFAEDVIFVIFILIYTYLAWDMLTIFLPRLRGVPLHQKETSTVEVQKAPDEPS